MILDNANVLTMDDTIPRQKVLAIAGGRILGGVDSREDPIASKVHERIDLRGLTVVPGFVESHCHFRAWALRDRRLDVAGAATFDDAVELVRAREAAPGGWVIAGGLRPAIAGEAREVREHLGRAAGDAPVAMITRDGHAALVNDAALRALSMTWDELDVDGGAVERDGQGAATGVLRERSATMLRERLPLDELDMKTMAGAVREAARRGVTSLHDMDGAAAFRTWRALEDERGLSVRVWVHLREDDLPHMEALGAGAGWGSERLRFGALKVFADGTMGSGTALLYAPDANGSSGIRVIEQEQLRTLARRAGAAGLPLAVHAIGDRAFAEVLDALEATVEHWSHLAMRPRIEHAQLVRREDLARAARLGVALVVQPAMLASDADELRAAWGSERAARSYAFASMRNAGCGLLLSSDAPVEPLSPLGAMHAAVTRTGGAHGLAPCATPFAASEALDPQTALLASTAWPADACGEEHRLGRLLPGREADVVVLSGDPLVEPIADIEVVATMVGGRWTYGAANLGLR